MRDVRSMAYAVGQTVEVCLEFDLPLAQGVRFVVAPFANERGVDHKPKPPTQTTGYRRRSSRNNRVRQASAGGVGDPPEPLREQGPLAGRERDPRLR